MSPLFLRSPLPIPWLCLRYFSALPSLSHRYVSVISPLSPPYPIAIPSLSLRYFSALPSLFHSYPFAMSPFFLRYPLPIPLLYPVAIPPLSSYLSAIPSLCHRYPFPVPFPVPFLLIPKSNPCKLNYMELLLRIFQVRKT